MSTKVSQLFYITCRRLGDDVSKMITVAGPWMKREHVTPEIVAKVKKVFADFANIRYFSEWEVTPAVNVRGPFLAQFDKIPAKARELFAEVVR